MRSVLPACALVLSAAGCAKSASKADRCDKAFTQSMQVADDLARSMGLQPDPPTAADKQRFLDLCSKLSDEALGCVTDLEKAKSPRCAEIMEQAVADAVADAPPVPIAWEPMVLDHARVTASVPRGWVHDTFVGDVFAPPEDAHYGLFTRYQISSTCGGACEPQPSTEWAKRFAANEVAELTSRGGEIVRDEPLGDHGRLVIARVKQGRKTVTHVVVGQWSEGGEIYFLCQAEVDAKIAGNLGDFETACRAMKGTSFRASYSE